MKMNLEKSKNSLLVVLSVLLLGGIVFEINRGARFFKPPPLEKTDSGIIADFKSNNHDDIDGIVLKTKTGTLDLGFFPHQASLVLNVAKKGDEVSVVFDDNDKHRNDKDQKLDSRILIITNLKNHYTLDLREGHPPPFDKGINTELVVESFIVHLDEKGNENGIVANNYFIEISPDMMKQIKPMLKAAKKILVKGKKRSNTDNYINHEKYGLIKADSITLDQATYLLN